MKHLSLSIICALIGISCFFTGCTTSSTQTTSGISYLNGYSAQLGGSGDQSDQS